MKRHMKSFCKQTVGFAKQINGLTVGVTWGYLKNIEKQRHVELVVFPCLEFSYTFPQQGTIRLWLACHGSLYCRDPCPIEFQLEPKRLDKLESLCSQFGHSRQ